MIKRLLLPIVLFLASAGGMVMEIVAGRLIAPYVGMSLYTWTAIISVVLAGLSVGHWIGGILASPGPDTGQSAGESTGGSAGERAGARGFKILACALGAAAVLSFASLALLRLISPLLVARDLGAVATVLILCAALFLLPSLLVGIVAPIITTLALQGRPHRAGPIIGYMFAIGTLGSIAGTLGAGYIFISWIGSTGTVIAVSAVYGLLALGCAIAGWRRGAGASPIGPSVGLVLIFGAVAGLTASVDGHRTACTLESDYFCIRIEDFSDISGRDSALVVLDNLVHSINDKADPSLLYSPYIHFVDEYARRRFHKRADGLSMSAFFIGGGGYTLPRSWAATMDNPTLLVAEIDPAVTRAAVQHLWLDTAAPGLEIRHGDARTVLQSLAPEPLFDVILGDAFHDISIPTHLVSRAFHGQVAVRLRGRGFYAVNVVDQKGAPQFLAAMVATLAHDFPTVEVWVEEEEYDTTEAGGSGRVTYIVIASRLPSREAAMTSIFGLDRRWRMLEARAMAKLAVGAEVLTDDYAPVDRLLAGVD